MLHLFDQDHNLICQLAPGHRVKHHTVCTLCKEDADRPTAEHFCIHAPDGECIDRIPVFRSRLDCSCEEADCSHFIEFAREIGHVSLKEPDPQ